MKISQPKYQKPVERETQVWLEIPVTVKYTQYFAEGDNWNSPYIPAHTEVNEIEIGDDLKEWIADEYQDEIKEAADEDRLDQEAI